MKFILFLLTLMMFSTISCQSSNKNKENKAENNIVFTEEGYAIITGKIEHHRLPIDRSFDPARLALVDDKNMRFFILPDTADEVKAELRKYFDCVIIMTATIVGEFRWGEGRAVDKSIKPISWELVSGIPSDPSINIPTFESVIIRINEPVAVIERAED